MSNKLLEAINKKRAEIKAQSNRLETLKIKNGSNRYRLLPSWRGDGEIFWHDYGQHYVKRPDGKFAVFTCLANTHGQTCPICQAIDEMRQRVDDATGKMISEAKSSKRILINVLEVQGDNPSQPQVLEVPQSVFDSILGLYTEWGDELLKFESGRDIIVERSGSGKNTNYNVGIASKTTDVRPSGKVTNLDDAVNQYTEQSKNNALEALSSIAGILPAPAVTKPRLTDIPTESAEPKAPPAIEEPLDVIDVQPTSIKAVAEEVPENMSNEELDKFLEGI